MSVESQNEFPSPRTKVIPEVHHDPRAGRVEKCVAEPTVDLHSAASKKSADNDFNRRGTFGPTRIGGPSA